MFNVKLDSNLVLSSSTSDEVMDFFLGYGIVCFFFGNSTQHIEDFLNGVEDSKKVEVFNSQLINWRDGNDYFVLEVSRS